MKNRELAKIFYAIAEYLEMDNIPFKPQAYEKAALSLEALTEDIENVYKKGGLKALEEIPGVGKSIAEKIEEYLKTGRVKYYESFKKKLPINLEEITKVEGIGFRKAKLLYEKLGIKNLAELETAAKEGKIKALAGFGEKTEKNILEGITFVKRDAGRFLLGEIMPPVKEVCKKLKTLSDVQKIDVAGSIRRMKETIGDVDFLVISKNPEPIMDFFVTLPEAIKIWGKGKTKSSVRTSYGFDMDIRVVPEKSYGAALQYFTGSKEHNVALRRIAIEKGLKLNEYGLFRGPKMLIAKNERDIYSALGMKWIPPEMRENRGEIEASQKNSLPRLIDYGDIKGDLHCHSNWGIAKNSIKEIAEAAMAMGYEYIGISDHTKFLRIEKGLDEKQLLDQKKEIEKINHSFRDQRSELRVLHGCEANILADGSLDIKDEVLAKLDYVIAGVHSQFKMPREKMTARIIKAMENPNVDIISHPTGRLLLKRDEYQIDFDKILKAAQKTGTIMEINSYPDRLDLKDTNIRKAKEIGVKMAINTDSHNINTLPFIEYGISQARRGWAEKEDIINTNPLKKLIKFFKQIA